MVWDVSRTQKESGGNFNAGGYIAKLPQQEQHKWEIAAELGLFDKIIEQGWEALTARESGRIGGMLAAAQRKKK